MGEQPCGCSHEGSSENLCERTNEQSHGEPRQGRAEVSGAGGGAGASRVREIGACIEPHIVGLRRRFHEHPELSGQEAQTADAVCAELDALGVPWRRVAENGVIATIAGTAAGAYDAAGAPRHRVALRADMDALPVTEQTGAAYASQTPGVMHACGHDGTWPCCWERPASCAGCAHALRGEVRLIFQPSEEVSIGSRLMIDAGALDGVDAIYGAHIWSDLDAGLFSCEPGQRMAHTDWFRIDIEGVSAHGSMPHKGVDAIVVGAEMVTALQVLVSRDVSPFEPVVVTVGEFHGGEARNIMAGSAYLTGTVRTWSERLRAEVPDRSGAHRRQDRPRLRRARRVHVRAGQRRPRQRSRLRRMRARRAVVEVLGEQAVGSYDRHAFRRGLQRVPAFRARRVRVRGLPQPSGRHRAPPAQRPLRRRRKRAGQGRHGGRPVRCRLPHATMTVGSGRSCGSVGTRARRCSANATPATAASGRREASRRS